MRFRLGAALLLVLLCVPALVLGTRASQDLAVAGTTAQIAKTAHEQRDYVAAKSKVKTYVRSRHGQDKVRGIVQVNHVDAGRDSHFDYSLQVGDRTIPLDLGGARIDGERPSVAGDDVTVLQSGQVIVASGKLTAGKLAVRTALSSGAPVVYGPQPITADPATQRGPTVRRAVVLPVMYADDPAGGLYDLNAVRQSLYGTTGDSVVDFYKASSAGYDSGYTTPSPTGGDVTLQFDVRDWKRVSVNRPATTTYCNDVRDAAGKNVIDETAVQALFGIDPATAGYDHYLYLLPCNGKAYAMGAVRGPNSYYYDGNQPSTGVVAHELGHNLGLQHSSRATCTVAGVPAPTADDAACPQVEYGDNTDVMGSATHLVSAFHRAQLGFLPTQNVKTVTPKEGATTQFYSSSWRLVPGTAQLVKIPRPVTAATLAADRRDAYYISLRGAKPPFDNYSATSPLLTGLEVQAAGATWDSFGPQANAIDTHPVADVTHPTGQTRDPQAFTLERGRSFFDPVEQYTITNRTAGSGAASIQVEPGPPRSPATSVGVSARRLLVRAGTGAVNAVVLGQAGSDLVVADYGNVTTPGPGCAAPIANNPQIVKCPRSGFDSVVVALGDGDDQASATAATTVPISFDGGAGNDTLLGGGGDDTLTGGAGQDYLSPGAGGADTVSYVDHAATEAITFDQTGTPARDPRTIYSTAGDDELATGRTFTTLLGSLGDDIIRWTADGGGKTVDGGAGSDTIQTGDGGGNTIRSRDGVADASLNCGAGPSDTVSRDSLDPAPSNCESSAIATAPVITSGAVEGSVVKTTAAFTFKSYVTPEPTTYECKLEPNQTAFTSCGASYTLPAFAAGPKTLRVRRVGDTSVTSRSFVTDATAPTVTITKRPLTYEGGRYNTVEFKASESANFSCTLDSTTGGLCSSPKSYADLPEGLHTMKVIALDDANNFSSVVSASWTVDRTLPDTTLSDGPTGVVTDGRPTYTFASPSTDTTSYECRFVPLDGSTAPAFAACSGATTHQPATALTDGNYRFEVRARDRAGNVDDSPATRDVTVLAASGTVTYSGTTATVTAFAGQANDIKVRRVSSVLTVDDVVSLRASTGCTQVTITRVTCAGATGSPYVNVYGGDGDDKIDVETGGRSWVRGQDGDDVLRATGGASNLIQGGLGNDTASYAGVAVPVQMSNNGTLDDGLISNPTDYIYADVENLVGGDAADELTGGTVATTLHGGLGDDRLTAGSGGALLDGGPGADTLTGGAGVDSVDYSSRNDSLAIKASESTADGAVVGSAEAADTLVGAIDKITGGSAGDTLRDAAGSQELIGGPGDDAFAMNGGGNDIARGGLGNDSFLDGAGDDQFFGDDGNDSFVLTAGSGSDTVSGGASRDSVDLSSFTVGVTVSLDGVRNDGVPGVTDQLDDLGADLESVATGAGDDTIVSGGLFGYLDLGAGTDTVSFANVTGAVTLNPGSPAGTLNAIYSATAKIITGAERIVGSPQADKLTGGSGTASDPALTIDGGAGDDTITGGANADTLIGGLGVDTLSGGGGNDRLESKDGVAGDSLTCGAGTDTALFDLTIDTLTVPADCETKLN